MTLWTKCSADGNRVSLTSARTRTSRKPALLISARIACPSPRLKGGKAAFSGPMRRASASWRTRKPGACSIPR
jgi:hypothetical protein